jgi:hypothetical protein
VTKEQVKAVDLVEYGQDGDRPHAKDVNLISSLFRANKQTLESTQEMKFTGLYVIAPVVAKNTVEPSTRYLIPKRHDNAHLGPLVPLVGNSLLLIL